MYQKIVVQGKGHFAIVVKCRNRLTQEVVAVKIISKCDLTQSHKQCIRDEVSIGSSINHPNVVQIKEVLEDKLNIYIVMEYVRGGDLHFYMKMFVLSEDLIKKVMF